MQIDELKNEGLTREYRITVGKAEIDRRTDAILEDLRTKVRMKGFRPGKTPVALIRKIHGEAVFGQAVEDSVREGTASLLKERNLRPALQPRVEVEKADAETGVAFTVATEILPEISVDDFRAPALERPVATPSDADVAEALERLAAQMTSYEDAPASHKAQSGDAVVIDFVGTIEGVPFEGGKGEGAELVLGSGQFVPGFEEQLENVKAGEEKTVEVVFPESYGRKDLAGKPAQFAVTVKAVRRPVAAKADDGMAKNFGLESLDALKDALRGQLAQEAAQLSRAKMKRRLLDALAERYDFEVPPAMVDLEYRDIWNQIRRDAVMSGEATEEELKDQDEPADEADRAEYRKIAERRVRLGLLLSEIGLANRIEVSRDELMRKLAEEARRFPGQERQVYDFYMKNEQAMAQLRAPIYEDKVVDFIIEQAEITEKEMSLEALRALVAEEDEASDATDASGSAKTAKAKSGAKKTAKKTATSATKEAQADEKKATPKKPAAKKPAAKKPAAGKSKDA